MVRKPTNLFTAERKQVLKDLMPGVSAKLQIAIAQAVGHEWQPYTPIGLAVKAEGISEEEIMALEAIGAYVGSTIMDNYEAINNPNHDAFHAAIDTLVDPEQFAFRGSFLPEEAGGVGLSIPAYMMGLEMIAQANASVALSLLIDGSVLNSVWNLGDEAQRQRYVIDALAEKKMTAFALTEPGHGSDAGGLQTKAILAGDEYIISGQKNWITNGGWAEYYFLVARTEEPFAFQGGTEEGTFRPVGGKSIIMVHKDEITDIRQMQKFTVPGSYTAELFFDEAHVPFRDGGDGAVKRRIGEAHRGFRDAKQLLTGGRVTVAAYGCGVASEAYDMAVDYAHERTTFGKQLIQHQDVAFRLAALKTRLDAARLLTYRAAKRMQDGDPMAHAEASQAKLFANQVAHDMTVFNRELHGSYGLSKEYKCMQLVHDAGVGVTGEGTAEVQKMLIAQAIRRNHQR